MLEKEITAFVQRYGHLKDSAGLKQIVRNGFHKERFVSCGIGEIRVSVPRSRDRRSGVSGKLVFQSRIIPRYMRNVAELDVYVPFLYFKGMMNGDFSDLEALLMGEEEQEQLSQTPDCLPEFYPERRYRKPVWHRPEDFNPYLSVDWRRYWKWKGAEFPPIQLKKKRKWWIRWGDWDGLKRSSDRSRSDENRANPDHPRFEFGLAVNLQISANTFGRTSYGFAHSPVPGANKQPALNFPAFQTDFPENQRAA